MLPNGHRTEIQSSRFITTVRSLLTKRTDEHTVTAFTAIPKSLFGSWIGNGIYVKCCGSTFLY